MTTTPEGTAPAARRLRVLQVVGNITLAGGAQRQVLEVVRRLPRERFRVEVVYLELEGDLAGRFREAGATVHDHGARGAARLWDPLGVLRTAARIRKGRFDLVHAHLSRAEIVTRLALGLAGRPGRSVPLIVHKHNEDAWWRRWHLARFHAAITRRAAALVAPSRRVVEFFRDPALAVADPDRFRVIPFGRVSPEPPPREEARRAVRAALGLPEDAAGARAILAAGRLVPQKRHDVLLDAFARVAERLPDARLAIAGAGALEGALRERAERPDLAGRVRFLGLVDDLPTWLAGCDLFVNSSEYEGLPLVVLDAMAARAPIVATRVSGVPDCVVDGETGRLVPPGEAGPLAEAMLEALERPGEARAWGEAARRRVEERFSMDRAAERWAELYEEVAAGGPDPAGSTG
ncbi:MAG: glycosyltransferase [Acidobacteriota bacterium]|jgi:starch synthase (maltosyl-transferring)